MQKTIPKVTGLKENLSVGDGQLISLIAINTTLAAVTSGIVAMLTVWLRYGKPDLTMTMNGMLAGLVAITAPCAYVSPPVSILIGLVSGILVVVAVVFVDKILVDDPVGAVAVHGFNGIWGTLAVGLFGQKTLGLSRDGLFYGGGFEQLKIQALGSFSVTLFCMIVMAIAFLIIKHTIGLRVSREEELRGLDIGEHGMESYSGFQIFINR